MEDQIKFDAYAIVEPSERNEAVGSLIESSIYSSEIEVRKSVMKSCSSSSLILIAQSLSWSEINKIVKSYTWTDIVDFYQEGYLPDKTNSYCKNHNLYYGGIFGCHVCKGFYQ